MTHWDQRADGYDAIMTPDPAMAALRDAVVGQVPAGSGRILDLGTGTGALLRLLRRDHPRAELVGLDPSARMLAESRGTMAGDERTRFVQASAHAIPLPDGWADAVVSNFALHHLTHPEKKICAHELFRVLRPGGVAVLGDQFCHRIGTPGDPDWVAEMFDLLAAKARHYLRTAGIARMLLQVELIPRFLRADGELPVPVEFWTDALTAAGFATPRVLVMEPPALLHRVVVAMRLE